MKKALTLFYILILSSPAFGTTYTFSDVGPTAVIHWAGWGNRSSQDSSDIIGYPQFYGGTYNIDDTTGLLTKISFNYRGSDKDIYRNIVPGDLFLDLGKDGGWDFAVKTYGGISQGDYDLYDLGNLAINPSLDTDRAKYLLSNSAWPASVGATVRNNHPVAVEDGIGSDTGLNVLFNGWHYGYGDKSTYYDFSQLNGGGLYIGPGDFQFGFTVNCANDVVLAQGTNPVPEPTTMLLLGFGLIGLIGVARRKGRI